MDGIHAYMSGSSFDKCFMKHVETSMSWMISLARTCKPLYWIFKIEDASGLSFTLDQVLQYGDAMMEWYEDELKVASETEDEDEV